MEVNQEEFAKWFEKEQKAGRDPVAQLRRRRDIEAFKEKYGAIKTYGLVCPACTDVGKMKEGHLWVTKEKNVMVCRNCEKVFYLECRTISNDELVMELKEQRKAEAKKEDKDASKD